MNTRDIAGAGIRSLEKGIGVLAALQAAPSPMRLNDIAKTCRMSASMAHGYLVSLVRTGFVTQDRQTGLYGLGDSALQLGLAALGRADFLRFARSALDDLAGRLGETVTLAVWSDSGPIVVDKIEGRHDSIYNIRVGLPVRLWPTVTGRMFMAHLPRDVWQGPLEAQLAAARIARSKLTGLERQLERARADGVATTLPATVPDFSAIAAPVFDHQMRLKGVIAVLGRASGFNVDVKGRNARTVRDAARALSRRLGAPDLAEAKAGVRHDTTSD